MIAKNPSSHSLKLKQRIKNKWQNKHTKKSIMWFDLYPRVKLSESFIDDFKEKFSEIE